MRGKLTVIEGRITGRSFYVPEQGEFTVGRVSENDVAIMDSLLSRRHCAFSRQGEHFVVVDKGSSNGTFVNDERKPSHVLRTGDRIRAGPVVFLFEIEEAAPEATTTLVMPQPGIAKAPLPATAEEIADTALMPSQELLVRPAASPQDLAAAPTVVLPQSAISGVVPSAEDAGVPPTIALPQSALAGLAPSQSHADVPTTVVLPQSAIPGIAPSDDESAVPPTMQLSVDAIPGALPSQEDSAVPPTISLPQDAISGALPSQGDTGAATTIVLPKDAMSGAPTPWKPVAPPVQAGQTRQPQTQKQPPVSAPSPAAQRRPSAPVPQAAHPAARQQAHKPPQAAAPPASAAPKPPAQPPVRCAKCGAGIAPHDAQSPRCRKVENETYCPRCTMNMRRVGTDIGDYRVLTLHAEGKTGALYKARHKLTNRLVAIKILNLKVEEGGPVVQRFLRAAGTGAKLIHNNIAQIYGSGVLEGQPYLVTEFVEGQTLKELVEKGGPLSQRRAADLIGCVAGALFQAHQAGIVHRDVQPANIMIDKEGTPKLIDLGMVKAAGESEAQVTAMGMTVGTPEYMAPEQATGAKDRDHRIDLYSLGATLYFAVTGRPPFTGKTPVEILKKAVLENPPSPSEFNPNLSADFARVILTGMAKKPADRFPTGRQMAATLAQFAVQR